MIRTLSNEALLIELAPTAKTLFDAHIDTARDWYPEEHITHDPAIRHLAPSHPGYTPYDPITTGISEGVRSALFVNLLTEDNLPYYFRTIEQTLGADNVWGEWGRRWTAEEARHSIAIRGIIMAKGLLDHRVVEDGRMAQMAGGVTPNTATAAGTLVYTDLQELATQVSHRNTGLRAKQESPEHRDVQTILSYVAGDETRHNNFYHSVTMKGFEIDPSTFVIAASKTVRGFAMPGTGIPGFKHHSANIASANIFSGQIYREQVLDPTLTAWDIEHKEHLTPEAEQERDKLVAYLEKMDRIAKKIEARATEQAEASAL